MAKQHRLGADRRGPPCIFCRRQTSSREPVEHIIPESLGCPDELVLANGEVCGKCNNRLSRADQRLIDVLQGFRVGIPGFHTKKGKYPRADFGGFVIERRRATLPDGSTGPEEMIFSVTPEAAQRYRVRRTTRAGFDGVSAETPLILDAGLTRALHKIGLEVVALEDGRNAALAPELDVARSYALHPRGRFRPVGMLVSAPPARQYPVGLGDQLANTARVDRLAAAGARPLVHVRLFGISFLVSLAADVAALELELATINRTARAPAVVTTNANGAIRWPGID